MYKYWGFGLKIISEIEFPEMMPFEFEDADLSIVLGIVPERLEGDHVVRKPFSSISDKEYIIKARNNCKCYAENGSKIIVEPISNSEWGYVRLCILGTVMAAILYQRKNIPLHSSAIVRNGKLVLFAGNSGAGKSSILAQFLIKGYEVFTDDICVLKSSMPDGQIVLGCAAYPMIKLWADTIAKFDFTPFTKEFKLRPKLPKYGQFFHDVFNLHWMPIDRIFVINAIHSCKEISIRKLTTLEAFKKLDRLAYRYQMIVNNEQRECHFELLSKLSSQLPVYDVTRPIENCDIELFTDTLKDHFDA